MYTMYYQKRVKEWLLACFGKEIASDKLERSFRFIEEALELAQACEVSKEQVLDLVNYVYGREIGVREQEVGGVMVTLAALCSAYENLEMDAAGEVELSRVWTKIDKIRTKHFSKPKDVLSAIPGIAAELNIIQRLNNSVKSFIYLRNHNKIPPGTPYKFILNQEQYDELTNLTQMEGIKKVACEKFNMSIVLTDNDETESMIVTKEGDQYTLGGLIPVVH